MNANKYPTMQEIEREAICNALRHNNGLRMGAAKELNISLRTLFRKTKQYNITVKPARSVLVE